MKDQTPAYPQVSIALVHHPVYDKNRAVVATAVTNLDIHDIARAAKTFGLARYYLVTPVQEQRALAERVRTHWVNGWGAGYNPKRKEALELISLASSLEEAADDMERRSGTKPRLIMTGARNRPNSISCRELSARVQSGTDPWLLVFGTGWGLTDEVMAMADHILEPIRGPGAYNHLSVRSAVSILLDRLFGR